MQTLPPATNEDDERLLIGIVTTYRVPRSPNYILSEDGETKRLLSDFDDSSLREIGRIYGANLIKRAAQQRK